jgi:hypothetical protein
MDVCSQGSETIYTQFLVDKERLLPVMQLALCSKDLSARSQASETLGSMLGLQLPDSAGG